jgi:DNA-binding CsgD family transcriptional regulator
MNNLPAGLLNDSIEFFADTNTLKAYALQSGAVISFDQFPEDLKALVHREMNKHPERVKALRRMVGDSPEALMKQYLYCTYGGFDNNPDLVRGVFQAPEYWPCPERGVCKFEGSACSTLLSDTGTIISRREVEVLRLVALGTTEEQIAEKLFLSVHTVAVHTRSLRLKIGAASKADLTRFAIQKNLI